MFNLNFDEGSPIAYINGGEYDGEILFTGHSICCNLPS